MLMVGGKYGSVGGEVFDAKTRPLRSGSRLQEGLGGFLRLALLAGEREGDGRTKAKTKVTPGLGDQGDQQKRKATTKKTSSKKR